MDKKKSGAKPKYDTPTIMVSFRCPENKVVDFKVKVRDILESYSNLSKGEVPVERVKRISNLKIEKFNSSNREIIEIPLKCENINIEVGFKKECDCYLDEGGLFRRGKDGCKKLKSQHKF